MNFEDGGKGLLIPVHKILCVGKYSGKIIRAGKVIEEFEDDNLVVNQGLNSILNVQFNGASQLTSWYLGIYQANYTPVATDTAATIAGNATESSGYTSATRPVWTPVASTAQSITNSASQATFTFNTGLTIYGAFLVSSNTIGGVAGTLFGAALFGTPKAVVNTDQLLLTYTFNAASA